MNLTESVEHALHVVRCYDDPTEHASAETLLDAETVLRATITAQAAVVEAARELMWRPGLRTMKPLDPDFSQDVYRLNRTLDALGGHR